MKPRSDAGLSLLELVAVMAIFSVVALMGGQLLAQATTNRETLARSDAQVSALVGTLAVLRRDLTHALPQPDDSGDQPAFAVLSDGISLVTASETGAATVTWQIDPAQDSLARLKDGAAAPTLTLPDVTSVQVEIFAGRGWVEAAAWQPDGPADLPQGLRVTLTVTGMGDVPVVVAR